MIILLMVWLSSIIWGRKLVVVNNPLQLAEQPMGDKPKDPKPKKELHPPIIGHLIDSISHALNCRIEIREANIKTTLNARPTLKSVFAKREKRKYIIRINHNPKFNGIYHHEVPDTARIGLWVHELMHIKDYQSRSAMGIMQRGWQYMTKSGRRVFEHEIDRMVVTQGYGESLYQWAQFIMYDSPASDSYKAYKQAVYLTPAQIIQEMGHGGYSHNH